MGVFPRMLPPWVVVDDWLKGWLLEDVGRGDRTTQAIVSSGTATRRAQWIAKESGVIAGLPIAARIFYLLDPQSSFTAVIAEGEWCDRPQVVAEIEASLSALLIGERTALNLAMRLSGIASMTRKYADLIADLTAKLVDTRKTTPGLRVLEKYATQVGGAINHRFGLDDAVMIKDNHIAAAGGIGAAIAQVRAHAPYPLSIEVETETLAMVEEALKWGADIIMLDNMPLEVMRQAVQMIRQTNNRIKIEASGNITLETIRAIAETGVDYISTSAPVTRSPWIDLSMKISG